MYIFFTNLNTCIIMRKLSFFLLSACMFLLVSCIDNNTPSAVTKQYLTLIQNGEYRKAVDMIHFNKELTDKDKDEVAELIKDKMDKSYGEEGKIKDIEITGEEIKKEGDSERAKVSYKYTDPKKGKEKKDKVSLVKVDGKWMIESGK